MPKFLGNGKKRREESRAEEECRQPLSEFAFRFPYSKELERGQLTTKDGEERKSNPAAGLSMRNRLRTLIVVRCFKCMPVVRPIILPRHGIRGELKG